jgi:hypothetical protein
MSWKPGLRVIGAALAGAALLTACGAGTPTSGVAQIAPEQGATVTTASRTTTTTTVTARTTVTADPVTQTVVETHTVTVPAAEPLVAFRDGTFLVNTEIQPGTYRAAEPTDDDCYWARLTVDGDIIQNDFSTVVTIKASDFSFESNRCVSWSKVG